MSDGVGGKRGRFLRVVFFVGILADFSGNLCLKREKEKKRSELWPPGLPKRVRTIIIIRPSIHMCARRA